MRLVFLQHQYVNQLDSIIKPHYLGIDKINEANQRFRKIAEYKKIELDIKFQCECKKNIESPEQIECKERNWYQKIYKRD